MNCLKNLQYRNKTTNSTINN